eukprot:g2833.t1
MIILRSKATREEEEKQYLKESCERLPQCEFKVTSHHGKEHVQCIDACNKVNQEETKNKERKEKCLALADPKDRQSIAKPCEWVRQSYVPFGKPGYCKVSTEVASPTSMIMRLLSQLKSFFSSSLARVKVLFGFKKHVDEAFKDADEAESQRGNNEGKEIQRNFSIALADKLINVILNYDASNVIKFLYSANVICEHFIEGRAHLKGSFYVVKFDPSGRLSEPFKQLKTLIEKVIDLVKRVNYLLAQLRGRLISAPDGSDHIGQIQFAKEITESCLDVVDYANVHSLCEQYDDESNCSAENHCVWDKDRGVCSTEDKKISSEDETLESLPACAAIHGTQDMEALRKIAQFENVISKSHRKKVSVGHIFSTPHRETTLHRETSSSFGEDTTETFTCVSPQSIASMPLAPNVARGESYRLQDEHVFQESLEMFCDSKNSGPKNECNIISMQTVTKDNRCLISPGVKAIAKRDTDIIIENPYPYPFNVGSHDSGREKCFKECADNIECLSAAFKEDPSLEEPGKCYLMKSIIREIRKEKHIEYELNQDNWFYAECVTEAQVKNGIGALQRKSESCLKISKCYVENGECIEKAKALWDNEIESKLAGKVVIIENEKVKELTQKKCFLKDILKNLALSSVVGVVITTTAQKEDALVQTVDGYREEFTTLPHFVRKGIITLPLENVIPFCFVAKEDSSKLGDKTSPKHLGLVGARTENLQSCFEKCIIRKKAINNLLNIGGILEIVNILKGLKEITAEAHIVFKDTLIPIGQKLIQSVYEDHLEEFQLFSSTWYKTLGNPKKLAVTASATASVSFNPDPEGIRKREKEKREADLLDKKEALAKEIEEYRDACLIWEPEFLGSCKESTDLEKCKELSIARCKEDDEITEKKNCEMLSIARCTEGRGIKDKQSCEDAGKLWISVAEETSPDSLARDTSLMKKADQTFREMIPPPKVTDAGESVEVTINPMSTQELLKGSQINGHTDISLDISTFGSTSRALSLIWEPKLNFKTGWKTPIPRLELFGIRLSLESSPEIILKQIGINTGTRIVLHILESSNVSDKLARPLLDILTNTNTKYADWLRPSLDTLAKAGKESDRTGLVLSDYKIEEGSSEESEQLYKLHLREGKAKTHFREGDRLYIVSEEKSSEELSFIVQSFVDDNTLVVSGERSTINDSLKGSNIEKDHGSTLGDISQIIATVFKHIAEAFNGTNEAMISTFSNEKNRNLDTKQIGDTSTFEGTPPVIPISEALLYIARVLESESINLTMQATGEEISFHNTSGEIATPASSDEILKNEKATERVDTDDPWADREVADMHTSLVFLSTRLNDMKKRRRTCRLIEDECNNYTTKQKCISVKNYILNTEVYSSICNWYGEEEEEEGNFCHISRLYNRPVAGWSKSGMTQQDKFDIVNRAIHAIPPGATMEEGSIAHAAAIMESSVNIGNLEEMAQGLTDIVVLELQCPKSLFRHQEELSILPATQSKCPKEKSASEIMEPAEETSVTHAHILQKEMEVLEKFVVYKIGDTYIDFKVSNSTDQLYSTLLKNCIREDGINKCIAHMKGFLWFQDQEPLKIAIKGIETLPLLLKIEYESEKGWGQKYKKAYFQQCSCGHANRGQGCMMGRRTITDISEDNKMDIIKDSLTKERGKKNKYTLLLEWNGDLPAFDDLLRCLSNKAKEITVEDLNPQKKKRKEKNFISYTPIVCFRIKPGNAKKISQTGTKVVSLAEFRQELGEGKRVDLNTELNRRNLETDVVKIRVTDWGAECTYENYHGCLNNDTRVFGFSARGRKLIRNVEKLDNHEFNIHLNEKGIYYSLEEIFFANKFSDLKNDRKKIMNNLIGICNIPEEKIEVDDFSESFLTSDEMLVRYTRASQEILCPATITSSVFQSKSITIACETECFDDLNQLRVISKSIITPTFVTSVNKEGDKIKFEIQLNQYVTMEKNDDIQFVRQQQNGTNKSWVSMRSIYGEDILESPVCVSNTNETEESLNEMYATSNIGSGGPYTLPELAEAIFISRETSLSRKASDMFQNEDEVWNWINPVMKKRIADVNEPLKEILQHESSKVPIDSALPFMTGALKSLLSDLTITMEQKEKDDVCFSYFSENFIQSRVNERTGDYQWTNCRAPQCTLRGRRDTLLFSGLQYLKPLEDWGNFGREYKHDNLNNFVTSGYNILKLLYRFPAIYNELCQGVAVTECQEVFDKLFHSIRPGRTYSKVKNICEQSRHSRGICNIASVVLYPPTCPEMVKWEYSLPEILSVERYVVSIKGTSPPPGGPGTSPPPEFSVQFTFQKEEKSVYICFTADEVSATAPSCQKPGDTSKIDSSGDVSESESESESESGFVPPEQRCTATLSSTKINLSWSGNTSSRYLSYIICSDTPDDGSRTLNLDLEKLKPIEVTSIKIDDTTKKLKIAEEKAAAEIAEEAEQANMPKLSKHLSVGMSVFFDEDERSFDKIFDANSIESIEEEEDSEDLTVMLTKNVVEQAGSTKAVFKRIVNGYFSPQPLDIFSVFQDGCGHLQKEKFCEAFGCEMHDSTCSIPDEKRHFSVNWALVVRKYMELYNGLTEDTREKITQLAESWYEKLVKNEENVIKYVKDKGIFSNSSGETDLNFFTMMSSESMVTAKDNDAFSSENKTNELGSIIFSNTQEQEKKKAHIIYLLSLAQDLAARCVSLQNNLCHPKKQMPPDTTDFLAFIQNGSTKRQNIGVRLLVNTVYEGTELHEKKSNYSKITSQFFPPSKRRHLCESFTVRDTEIDLHVLKFQKKLLERAGEGEENRKIMIDIFKDIASLFSKPKSNVLSFKDFEAFRLTQVPMNEAIQKILARYETELSKLQQLKNNLEKFYSNPTPSGWEKFMSPSTGDEYYYNTATDESAWELPTPDTVPSIGSLISEDEAERNQNIRWFEKYSLLAKRYPEKFDESEHLLSKISGYRTATIKKKYFKIECDGMISSLIESYRKKKKLLSSSETEAFLETFSTSENGRRTLDSSDRTKATVRSKEEEFPVQTYSIYDKLKTDIKLAQHFLPQIENIVKTSVYRDSGLYRGSIRVKALENVICDEIEADDNCNDDVAQYALHSAGALLRMFGSLNSLLSLSSEENSQSTSSRWSSDNFISGMSLGLKEEEQKAMSKTLIGATLLRYKFLVQSSKALKDAYRKFYEAQKTHPNASLMTGGSPKFKKKERVEDPSFKDPSLKALDQIQTYEITSLVENIYQDFEEAMQAMEAAKIFSDWTGQKFATLIEGLALALGRLPDNSAAANAAAYKLQYDIENLETFTQAEEGEPDEIPNDEKEANEEMAGNVEDVIQKRLGDLLSEFKEAFDNEGSQNYIYGYVEPLRKVLKEADRANVKGTQIMALALSGREITYTVLSVLRMTQEIFSVPRSVPGAWAKWKAKLLYREELCSNISVQQSRSPDHPCKLDGSSQMYTCKEDYCLLEKAVHATEELSSSLSEVISLRGSYLLNAINFLHTSLPRLRKVIHLVSLKEDGIQADDFLTDEELVERAQRAEIETRTPKYVQCNEGSDPQGFSNLPVASFTGKNLVPSVVIPIPAGPVPVFIKIAVKGDFLIDLETGMCNNTAVPGWRPAKKRVGQPCIDDDECRSNNCIREYVRKGPLLKPEMLEKVKTKAKKMIGNGRSQSGMDTDTAESGTSGGEKDGGNDDDRVDGDRVDDGGGKDNNEGGEPEAGETKPNASPEDRESDTGPESESDSGSGSGSGAGDPLRQGALALSGKCGQDAGNVNGGKCFENLHADTTTEKEECNSEIKPGMYCDVSKDSNSDSGECKEAPLAPEGKTTIYSAAPTLVIVVYIEFDVGVGIPALSAAVSGRIVVADLRIPVQMDIAIAPKPSFAVKVNPIIGALSGDVGLKATALFFEFRIRLFGWKGISRRLKGLCKQFPTHPGVNEVSGLPNPRPLLCHESGKFLLTAEGHPADPTERPSISSECFQCSFHSGNMISSDHWNCPLPPRRYAALAGALNQNLIHLLDSELFINVNKKKKDIKQLHICGEEFDSEKGEYEGYAVLTERIKGKNVHTFVFFRGTSNAGKYSFHSEIKTEVLAELPWYDTLLTDEKLVDAVNSIGITSTNYAYVGNSEHIIPFESTSSLSVETAIDDGGGSARFSVAETTSDKLFYCWNDSKEYAFPSLSLLEISSSSSLRGQNSLLRNSITSLSKKKSTRAESQSGKSGKSSSIEEGKSFELPSVQNPQECRKQCASMNLTQESDDKDQSLKEHRGCEFATNIKELVIESAKGEKKMCDIGEFVPQFHQKVEDGKSSRPNPHLCTRYSEIVKTTEQNPPQITKTAIITESTRHCYDCFTVPSPLQKEKKLLLCPIHGRREKLQDEMKRKLFHGKALNPDEIEKTSRLINLGIEACFQEKKVLQNFLKDRVQKKPRKGEKISTTAINMNYSVCDEGIRWQKPVGLIKPYSEVYYYVVWVFVAPTSERPKKSDTTLFRLSFNLEELKKSRIDSSEKIETTLNTLGQICSVEKNVGDDTEMNTPVSGKDENQVVSKTTDDFRFSLQKTLGKPGNRTFRFKSTVQTKRSSRSRYGSQRSSLHEPLLQTRASHRNHRPRQSLNAPHHNHRPHQNDFSDIKLLGIQLYQEGEIEQGEKHHQRRTMQINYHGNQYMVHYASGTGKEEGFWKNGTKLGGFQKGVAYWVVQYTYGHQESSIEKTHFVFLRWTQLKRLSELVVNHCCIDGETCEKITGAPKRRQDRKNLIDQFFTDLNTISTHNELSLKSICERKQNNKINLDLFFGLLEPDETLSHEKRNSDRDTAYPMVNEAKHPKSASEKRLATKRKERAPAKRKERAPAKRKELASAKSPVEGITLMNVPALSIDDTDNGESGIEKVLYELYVTHTAQKTMYAKKLIPCLPQPMIHKSQREGSLLSLHSAFGTDINYSSGSSPSAIDHKDGRLFEIELETIREVTPTDSDQLDTSDEMNLAIWRRIKTEDVRFSGTILQTTNQAFVCKVKLGIAEKFSKLFLNRSSYFIDCSGHGGRGTFVRTALMQLPKAREEAIDKKIQKEREEVFHRLINSLIVIVQRTSSALEWLHIQGNDRLDDYPTFAVIDEWSRVDEKTDLIAYYGGIICSTMFARLTRCVEWYIDPFLDTIPGVADSNYDAFMSTITTWEEKSQTIYEKARRNPEMRTDDVEIPANENVALHIRPLKNEKNTDDPESVNFSIELDEEQLPEDKIGGIYPNTKRAIIPRLLRKRKVLRLVKSALFSSKYTDHVDRRPSKNPARRLHKILHEVCALLSGIVTALDYKEGQSIISSRDFQRHSEFLTEVFEIARRHKILNPEKMRTSHGKLLYLLQDSNSPACQELLTFSLFSPMTTVYSTLEDANALDLLRDPLIHFATMECPDDKSKTRAFLQARIQKKNNSIRTLVQKYTSRSLDAETLKNCLYSIGDNSSYLGFNRDPIDKMIKLLTTHFNPNHISEGFSLAIVEGSKESRLTHSHNRQFHFVYQSLLLWRAVTNNMYKLWILAELDMMEQSYNLVDTGQGLNRLQQSPRVMKAMREILHETQQQCDKWIGSSVIHLGDHNVPNAIFFIDKYTQISRILRPIITAIEQLPRMAKSDAIARYINTFGGIERLTKTILHSFFRHGFDGGGASNFFDAGSCIDGRLTSAWNWCSQLHKQSFYGIFKLSGFTSFDGESFQE